jgi:kynurenine formamidase
VRLIDLSTTLSNGTSSFEPMPHRIEYIDHATSPKTSANLVAPELWPGGSSGAVERVELGTHAGTHVDAPYHYGPTSGGEPAKTVEQVPLEWFYGPGVLLDMSHKGEGEGITADDVRAELRRIEHELQPGDIVLVRTDASRFFESPGYQDRHAGLRRSATELIVRSGVKLIGIDAWGLDRPFSVMAAEAEAGDTGQLWESHFFGREMEYCQIEKLTNLAALPRPTGFTVCAFPVKLEKASGAWTRAVAMLGDED